MGFGILSHFEEDTNKCEYCFIMEYFTYTGN